LIKTIASQTTKPAEVSRQVLRNHLFVLKHFLEIMWLWSYLIWQNRKRIKEGKWGRKAGQFCTHSSANTHKERLSCEWRSFSEMAFRTQQRNVSMLLLLSVCLHFMTGRPTVAFNDLSGVFADLHQILVMWVMWDTWLYVSWSVFRKQDCCNIPSRKMWVHWGDWLGAMEKNQRLHNYTERRFLQQGSNHVSKQTSFPCKLRGIWLINK